MRTTPIPPSPTAVAIAAMVSWYILCPDFFCARAWRVRYNGRVRCSQSAREVAHDHPRRTARGPAVLGSDKDRCAVARRGYYPLADHHALLGLVRAPLEGATR